jgi:hypothetical protein
MHLRCSGAADETKSTNPESGSGELRRALKQVVMAAKGVAPALMLSSGHGMPAVGLGVWRMDKPAIRNLIHSALRIGYRHLDCAGKPPNFQIRPRTHRFRSLAW